MFRPFLVVVYMCPCFVLGVFFLVGLVFLLVSVCLPCIIIVVYLFSLLRLLFSLISSMDYSHSSS